METKFQTSFIPKKPLPSVGIQGVNTGVPTKLKPVKPGSLLLNIAILIFIISIGAGAVVYAWKIVLQNNQNSYKLQLAEKQSQFNPELISQLKIVNVKIDTAKQLLSRHIAASNIFDIVGKMTTENVRYLGMEVRTPLGRDTQGAVQGTPGSPSNINVTLNGQGINLSSVAFQAQVLAELDKYGLSELVRNPVLSDPDIGQDGSVSFKLTHDIRPSAIIYMKGATPTQ